MNSLGNIKTISKRELMAYFSSPVAYVFIVIFLLLNGFFTFMVGGFFERGEAALTSSFFVWHPWFYLFLVPAVGMRLWADERRWNVYNENDVISVEKKQEEEVKPSNSEEEAEPKSCPWCHSMRVKSELIKNTELEKLGFFDYFPHRSVVCINCGARGPIVGPLYPDSRDCSKLKIWSVNTWNEREIWPVNSKDEQDIR